MGVLGDYSAAIAAIAAAASAGISLWQFNAQVNKQKERERPNLIPLNKDVYLNKNDEFLDMHIGNDWQESRYEKQTSMKIYDSFSQFTFPIMNTGGSAAIKVKIIYSLENAFNSIKEIDTEEIKVTLENPECKQLPDNEEFSFTLTQHVPLFPKEKTVSESFKIQETEFRMPLIKNNESENIRLPFYFLVLNNLYLDGLQDAKPRLRFTIIYEDQNHEKHHASYRVELKKQKVNPHYDKEEHWLDFTKIKTNNKKAHP
ncbi:hypothetical protein [Exiguobacterium sp. R-39]|uniref:hypothetical protein n=1 Tax=Exiguobacterium sp. R-39 TaxID=3416708 RepID=UPI003CE9F5E2